MLKQKLAAILLIAITIPVCVMDRDITLPVFASIFAIPMFFTKKKVFY